MYGMSFKKIIIDRMNWNCTKEEEKVDLSFRGCVAETERLNPTTFANGRRTSKDMQIGGYFIPAGENVVFNNLRIARDSDIYPLPIVFNPYRCKRHAAQDISYSR